MWLHFCFRLYYFVCYWWFGWNYTSPRWFGRHPLWYLFCCNTFPLCFKYGCSFWYFWSVYYWVNAIIGLQYNEFLRKLHFYTFLGVNITFAPTHILSIVGLPVRVPDYPTIYASTNNLPTFGHILSIFSLLIFL